MVAGSRRCSVGMYSSVPYEFQLAVGNFSDYSLTTSVSSTGCRDQCKLSTTDFPTSVFLSNSEKD